MAARSAIANDRTLSAEAKAEAEAKAKAEAEAKAARDAQEEADAQYALAMQDKFIKENGVSTRTRFAGGINIAGVLPVEGEGDNVGLLVGKFCLRCWGPRSFILQSMDGDDYLVGEASDALKQAKIVKAATGTCYSAEELIRSTLDYKMPTGALYCTGPVRHYMQALLRSAKGVGRRKSGWCVETDTIDGSIFLVLTDAPFLLSGANETLVNVPSA